MNGRTLYKRAGATRILRKDDALQMDPEIKF